MKKILLYILLLTTSFISLSQEKQKDEGALQVGERKADTPFSLRQELSLRGNLTFIANNTLNRSGVGGSSAANNAFNGNGKNDDNGSKNMDYIDIDGFVDENNDGNDDTESSSSATLSLPNCSRIEYAGLYWAGIYPYQHWDDEEFGINTRDDDFNEMKFRLPGASSYTDIVADKFDATARELIYDDGLSDQKPYVCYKDVTSLLQGLADPNGVYYGANIKATKGKDSYDSSLGSSAGWVLVVIYENETESQKKFFVFDGFSTIKRQDDGSAGVYDVPFSGFKTIPVGQVEANFMIAALEGDVNIDGDELQLEDTSGNFQSLTSGDENEIDNFFNSTITINNNYLTGRTPDSENTLGLDVDMFELNNSGNSLIGNDQEDGVLRFSSEGDTYWPFLTALSVEVIEPKVQLVKTIDDGTGVPNNLAGQDVTLGSYLWYDIAFQNVGTDDAVSTTIVDILPKNVDLLASDLIVPAGVTYVYEPPTAANDFRGRLTFTIPNNLVEEDDPAYSIRFRVQVAADCNLLRDACSNIIQNQAYANYTGDESGIVISNEESFESLDACNFGVVGTSNFLVDIDNCAFERTQALCGADVTLTAGDGFDTYSWTGPNGFSANTQSVTVTELGTYVVTRGTTSVCKSGTETITVISYDTAPNPLVDAADRILDTCPNNSFELAEIYLCGGTSSREIDLSSFSGTATTVRWFQLDESSCADETFTGCANVATDCTWNEVGSGELSRDFTDAGEFRLDVLYDGQCPISYYFNVYKATLNPVIDVEDIICGTPAEMTISNIPDGYQYSLSGVTGTATAGYFVDFQDSNIFTNITQAGDYNLTIRLDNAVAASCEYTFPLINVQALDIELVVNPVDMQCADGDATITASINNVPGPYTYILYQGATTGGTVIGTQTAIADNNFEFTVTDGGVYTVAVSTPECSAEATVNIDEPSQLTLDAIGIKDITCLNGDNPGTIQLTAGGGTIDTTSGNSYTFAVWSVPDSSNPSGYNDLYTGISTIPASEQLTSGTNTYTYSVPNGSEGTYRFVVIDHNNCFVVSAPVEIEVEPALTFTNSDTDITCNGLTDGIINIAVDGDNLGYNIEYSINGTDWFTSGTFNNLPVNTYTVNIRATKTTHQCDYVIPNIEITEPPVLAGGNAVATDLECNPAGGTVLGTITFTAPTDGTPGYSYYYKLTTDTDYTLAAFDSGLTVIDLPAGTYDTRVEDANDCPLDLNQVTINGLPTAPTLTETVVYNCDGTGNITVVATPVGTYTYTLGSNTNNTGVFTNEDVGDHTITVDYGSNCDVSIVATVEPNNAFNATVTDFSGNTCNNSNDGTIEITAVNIPSGGTTFEYNLNGTGWNTATANPFTITGQASGNYTVQVRPDATSVATCTLTIDTITLANPTLVVADANVTKEVTCVPNTGATITPSASQGNGGPYTFELFDSTNTSVSTTSPFTNVAAGAYTVVATDRLNCTSAPFAVTVDAKDDVDFNIVPVLCYTGSNGTLTVNVTSGNGNYQFSSDNGTTWQTPDAATPNTYTFTNLTDGDYDITVTDGLGCDLTRTGTILPQVTATITTVNETCNTGQILITPSGGDGNFEFYIEETSNAIAPITTSTSPINVPAGTYNITVRDKNGGANSCSYTETRTITRITDPTIDTSTVQPDCDTDTGTINVTVGAGTAPYTVTVTGLGTPAVSQGPSNNLNYTFTGLADDTYTITVSDANGCSPANATETISVPLPLTGGTATATDLACSASGTVLGTIVFTAPSGGTMGSGYIYFYKLSTDTVFTQIAGTSVSNLAAGTYDTKVEDVNGCERLLNQVTIAPLPGEPTLTDAVVYNCDGTGNVTITAAPGPTAPATYTYILDGNAAISNTTGIFNNVGVGGHTVSVGYGSNCTVDINVTVEPDQEFDAVITGSVNPTCIGDSNGTVTVEASFPSSTPTAFEYNIGAGWVNSGANPFAIPGFSAGATPVIQIRPVGVTSGCDVSIASITLSDPTAIVVAAPVTKEVTCVPNTGATITPSASQGNGGPYTFELFDSTNTSVSTTSPFTNVAAGAYTVVATDVRGCTSAPFNVTVNAKDDVDFNIVPVTCYTGSNGTLTVNVTAGNGDYQFNIDGGPWQTPDAATPNTYTFTNLTNGSYDITVTDGLGCELTRTSIILPQVTANIATVNETCNTGQILITPSGGDGNFVFVVENTGTGAITNHTTSPIDVPAGTYNISVRDKNGGTDYCEYTETRTITRITDPTISTSAVQPDCDTDTGTINVTVGAGTAPYTVTVTGSGAPVSQGPSNNLNYTFTGLADDTYTITVSDANGCSPVDATETISVPSALSGGSATATDLACSTSGTVLGTITFTAPIGGTIGTGYVYFYKLSTDTVFTQIAGTSVSNLAAGTYDTKVEDANGCERSLGQVIIAPLPTEPTLTEAVVYNCDGTGNITITPMPAGTYTYILDGDATTSNTTGVFNGVDVGGHTVSVGYGSNCTVDINVTVEPNQAFNAVITGSVNPTCIGDSNGTVTVEASFPSGTPTAFEYNIGSGWVNSGANPFAIPGFSAGATGVIQVRPVGVTSGCDVSIDPITLSDPTAIVVTAPVTKEVTCVPATGATITPTASQGNGGPYTFELFDSTNTSVSTTSPFTNVAAGDYTVVATDVSGCTSAPFAVTVNPRADVTFTPVAQCYDGSNGQIVVTVNTGNGDYSYSLDGGTNFTPVTTNPFTISSLSPGDHDIRVQDGRGCFADAMVTINPELFATATPTNASCTPTGEISVNPVGGSGTGYTFSAVPDGNSAGTFSGTNTIIGLTAGTYDVYVRDDANCEYIIQDVVIGTTPPVEITGTPNEPTCNGDTGSVDGVITAGTGQAPHTIVIRDSSNAVVETINNFTGTNFNFNNLAADSYVITITDDLNCTDTYNFSLTNPPAIVMDIEGVLPPGCIVDSTLTGFNFINIDPNDYLPNTLQYSIDNGATWIDFTTTNGQVRNLNSGDLVYPVLRTIDGSGNTLCLVAYGQYEILYNVTGLIVDPVANPGNCAVGFSVTVEALNSAGPFEFAINTPSGWVGPDALNNGTSGDPNRTYTFTGLTPGLSYDFFVRDIITGCIEKNNEDLYADYTPTVPISSVVNNQSCFGATSGQITFSIDNTSGDLSNDFNWTLYERDLVTNVGSPVSAAYTNVNQIGFADIVVTGLAAGTYYIVLTNNVGTVCNFGSLDVLINPGTQISGDVTKINDITCSVDGSVRIENVVGGFPGYTYTYNLTGATAATLTGNIITVAAADVTASPVGVEVFAQDTNGCGPISLGTVNLDLSPSPNIDLVTPTSCDVNKSIAITVSSGTAPYRYSTDNGATFTAPTNSTTYTANGLAAGSYDIVVSDANGCSDTQAGVIIYDDIAFDLSVTQNATCVPGNDAIVAIDVTLGSGGDYNYSFDTGSVGTITSPATTVNVSSLAPGLHNVTITDVTSGCSDTKQITVLDPVDPSFTHVTEDSLCASDNSGTITLTAVVNGAEPTSYSINPVAGTITGNVISDLPPNTYSVTGTAANGCTFTINNIVIDEYNAIVPSAPNVTEFGCTTGNTVDVATVTIPAGTVGGSNNYVRYVFTYTPADASGVVTQDSSSAIFSTTNTSGGPITIQIFDDQGCASPIVNSAIGAFEAITTLNVNQATAITCNTGEEITVKTASDIANVNYEITSGPTGFTLPAVQTIAVATNSATFTGLIEGTYTITATHPTTNCTIETFYTVDAEPSFDILISDIENVDCQTDSNGSVVLSFSASTPYGLGYSYVVYTSTGTATAITGTGNGGTPEIISGLSAGEYYVIIDMGVNSPFCTAQSANFTIAEPTDPLSVVGVENPAVSCRNGSDATITATPAGGWGDYVYQLESPVGTVVAAYDFATNGSNNIFTNLSSGTYTIRIRDKNGVAGEYCESTDQVVIANPSEVTFNITENDNVCDTTSGGSITVTAGGGTGTYTYTLSNGSGVVETQILNATTYTFTNLAADTYTVNVVDSNGCDAGTPTNVTINPDVNFSLTETKKVDCSVSPDGIVTVDLVDWTLATSNYEYDVVGSVDGAITANVAITSDPFTITILNTNTTPQTYTVTVRDLNATPVCDVSRDIVIQPRTEPDFTYVAEDSLCSGDNSGIITLTAVDNGILPLTYTISPVAGTITGNVITNLPPNIYSVTATGANGCTTTINNIEIDEYNAIVPSTPNVTEFGCTTGNTVDVATVTIPAGTTEGSGTYVRYVFTYDPADGSPDEIQDSSNASFSTTNTSGGPVSITIYDDQGCTGVTNAVIGAFEAITALNVNQATAITCNTGEEITVKTTPDIANVDYEITNGPTGFTLPAVQTVALATDSATFTGLIEGTYTITATHPTTNCVFETFYTVNEAPQFDLLITEVKDESCKDAENGKVVLEFNSTTPYGGQFDFELYDAATNTTLDLSAAGLNIPNSGLTAPTSVYKLPAGTYYIIATLTSTGVPYCTAQTANFTIAEPDENLAITAVVDPQTSCSSSTDATITATATGGWGDYVYQLEDSAGTIVGTYDFATNGNNNIFENIPPGDYRVIVRDKDGQGDLINAAEAISCRRSEFPVTVITRAPVNFTVNENDNSCDLSVAGGSIEVVNVVGGTGTYTYTLSNTGGVVETQVGSTATTYTFNNVPTGDYTVSVVDSNGCSNTAPIAITINPKLNFSLTETKKVDCSATPDGQVELELTNWPSTSTYTYDVVGSVDGNLATGVSITANPTVITIPATNGTPQIYTVTVNDTGATPNCSIPKDIVIQPRIEPSFTATASVDDICFASSTGEITVSVTDNGILPLDYTISPDPNLVGTVNSNTNVVFSNLPQGTYTITGVGTNGCSTQTDVTINQNNIIDLSAAITPTQFNCNAGTNTVNTAMITVDPAAIIGGSGNYVRVEFLQGATSLQNGSSFTYISTDEAGGTYTVNVYDDNGDCFGTDTVDINPFARLIDATVSVQKTIDCAQGEDINVTYNSSLPVTNVEFRLINDTSNAVLETRNTDGDFVTLLPTGTYRIEIENTDTNCLLLEYHTVEDEPEFELVIDNIQDACFGDTGNVDLSFSTATPYADDYTYEVFAVGNPTAVTNGTGNGSAAITINNLPAGNYYVVINMTPNSPFCEVTSREFEIRQPAADLGANYTLTYISCNVSDSGGVVLEGIGGWGNYQYELVNNTTATTVQNFDPNTRITGLTAGQYTITVRDENGCTEPVNFELQDPTPLAAVITVNENDCEGQFTASIEVTNVTGGQTQDTTIRSYTYILILPDGTQVEQSSNEFNNLPAGMGYQVIVRDNKYNCEFRDTRNIIDPSEVQASADITAAITCDRSQAEVTLSGQGGTGITYTFSEDGVNFVLGNTFNVNAGEHTFYVQDENSCVDDVVITVAAYEALVPTLNVVNNVTCNGNNNGTLSADVVGGLGNYEYQLLDDNDVEIRTWQQSNLFGDLLAGFYKINVRSTNAAGDECRMATGVEEITEPTPLLLDEDHTDVTCFGGSNGTIEVFASGANETLGYEYNINTEPADKFVEDNVFRNLPAGTYIITVKDKVGCVDTIEVEIEEPVEFSATLVSVDEQDCINDPSPVVTLGVQGGTMPYFVRINNGTEYGPYSTNTITIGAAEGIVGGQSYFFSVRDSGAGCDPAAPITFQTAEPVDLQLTVDFAYRCEVGNIIKAIVDDKYKNSMSYTLYDGAGSPVTTNNTGEFEDVATGNGYYVVATHTTTNCSEDSTSDPIDILDIQALTMTVDDSQKNLLIIRPEFGLPPYRYSIDGSDFEDANNSDGTFSYQILQTKDYTITVRDARDCEITLTVRGVYVTIFIPDLFSPDGDNLNEYWYPKEVEDYHDMRVFIYDRYARKIINFQGVQSQGWDGTYDGKPLPSGDYWYTIYYKELSGEEKKLMGHFTLYR